MRINAALSSVALLLAMSLHVTAAQADGSTQGAGMPYDKCIRYHRGSEGSDISVFINDCSVHLNYVIWVDGKNLNVPGLCVGKPVSCGADIGALSKDTAFDYTGIVHVAACKWPDTPIDDANGISYRCPSPATGSEKSYTAVCNCNNVKITKQIMAQSRAEAAVAERNVCVTTCSFSFVAKDPKDAQFCKTTSARISAAKSAYDEKTRLLSVPAIGNSVAEKCENLRESATQWKAAYGIYKDTYRRVYNQCTPPNQISAKIKELQAGDSQVRQQERTLMAQLDARCSTGLAASAAGGPVPSGARLPVREGVWEYSLWDTAAGGSDCPQHAILASTDSSAGRICFFHAWLWMDNQQRPDVGAEGPPYRCQTLGRGAFCDVVIDRMGRAFKLCEDQSACDRRENEIHAEGG